MDASNGERVKLRAERDRLKTKRTALKTEVARLADSQNLGAIRALQDRLHRHSDAVHAFEEASRHFISDSVRSGLAAYSETPVF